jgi:hypothetical protein
MMHPSSTFATATLALAFGFACAAGRPTPAFAQVGQPVAEAGATARDIASRATPAVVAIRALRDGDVVSSGSGFVIRAEGVIVTNVHVIAEADALEIELATGEVFDNIFVLGTDERRDVALLKVPATQLPALEIGDANRLATGDPVFVVGNPLGMDRSFSDGLISARRVLDGVGYLQITAPVSEGSSGGPVLDGAGRVVGITTASLVDGQNLNMAIPIGYAEGLLSVASDPVPFAEIAIARHDSDNARADGDADAGETPRRALADPRFEGLEPWERVVAEQLVTLAQRLRAEEFAATDDNHFAAIPTDSIDHVAMELEPGFYRAIAVCDQDCSDIDLQVSDDEGEVLDTDILEDDVPIVDFLAHEAGTFHFAVQVVKCTTETCFYGLQVYRKD